MEVLDQDDERLLCRDLRDELAPCVLESVADGERMEPLSDVEAERQTEDLSARESFENG
jgi:hypothetical protein